MKSKVSEAIIADLKPYPNNPRNNDEAVPIIVESIKEFGFIGAIVINRENVIINGHTRVKAMIELGKKTIPAIVVDHLTKEQEDALRIADNKTGEVVDSYTERRVISTTPEKSLTTSIPFLKNTELNYNLFTAGNDTLAWLLYIVVAIFVITAVSNGANLTDGIDGLLTGVSVPIVIVLGALAYLSGHIIYSDYLNIMYIPDSGELLIFAAAFAGALVGFLWYNSFPAQVFMGDTGSLTIGGLIAVFALCIRKELLLPLLCGVFLVEALSVMVQVGYFKYTKRKYGEGRRILLMSPIHHHYQKKGLFETKIMMRFFIISLILSALTLVTLKIQ